LLDETQREREALATPSSLALWFPPAHRRTSAFSKILNGDFK
jgi:hypothetical protein